MSVAVTGNIDDGGVVRGVLIKLHADDVRAIGQAGFLFKDVRVTIEVREPDSPVTP